MEEIDDYFRELRGERRSRAIGRTPGSGRRRKTPQTPAPRGRSRSRATTARKLSLPSVTRPMSVDSPARVPLRTVAELARPKDERLKFDLYHLNKGKSLHQIDLMWERRLAGKYKLKTRKVRHKNARSTLKKMPRGGKPYARRRMSSKKTYRGAVLPRQFRGETKHILINDACRSDVIGAVQTGTLGGATTDTNAGYLKSSAGEKSQKIGDIHSWCLNPILQNNKITGRNGRQVDATYLRIQGHIRNNAVSGGTQSTDNTNKAYVRMMVLLVKGNRPDNAHATFSASDMFKKIDGSVVGYVAPTTSAGSGSAAVRTLQLEVNKGLYTKLYDQKMQLANKGESFGSSDRLFDAKIPLKQKIKFTDGDNADSFQTNDAGARTRS